VPRNSSTVAGASFRRRAAGRYDDQEDLYFQRLHSRLDQVGGKNELLTVKDAGHDGRCSRRPKSRRKSFPSCVNRREEVNDEHSVYSGSNTNDFFLTASCNCCGSDLTLWLSASCANAETSPKPTALPPLHANGTAIVDDKGQPVLLRGCNLGNWLLNELWMMEMWRPDDPKDQWQMEELLQQRFGVEEKERLLELYRENWIKRRDFDIIKSWRFNVVRLPFYYGLLEDDATPVSFAPMPSGGWIAPSRWPHRRVSM